VGGDLDGGVGSADGVLGGAGRVRGPDALEGGGVGVQHAVRVAGVEREVRPEVPAWLHIHSLIRSVHEGISHIDHTHS
jgi:hypothetical protein